MKIKIPYTWALARSEKFNQDAVRRSSKSFREVRNSCFVSKKTETAVGEIKDWLIANDISQFSMYGVFDDTPTKVYYLGIQFVFESEDQTLFFKLRFF
jgi:hypothetical protein